LNLLELKTNVDYIINNLRDYQDPKDIIVAITLSESSIGSRAFARIYSVGMGFDWESGQFRIEPQDSLVREGNTFKDVKKVECKPFEGRNYYFCPRCEGKISNDDKFCRYCGQKLK